MCSLVRFTQETLQAKKHALDIVDGTPLVLEDVEADTAREVEVGVVDWGLEEDGRGRVGVVIRESEGELEGEAFIGCLGRAYDCCCPREEVAVCVREGGDAGGWGEHQLHQFGLESVRMKGSWSISCSQRGETPCGLFEGVCAGDTNRLVTLCVSLL